MKIEKMVLGMVCALAFSGVSLIADEGSVAAPAPVAPAAAPEMAAPAAAPVAPVAEAKVACKMKMCDKCQAMVKENDADKNGTLNAAEFDTLFAACMKMQAKKTDVKAGAEAPKMPTAAEAFAKADADTNGELSADEMAAACVADANGCPDCKAMNAECKDAKADCSACSKMKMDGDKDDEKAEEAAPAPAAAPEMK